MALGGYALGGASAAGPSRAYKSLPWAGYREQSGWVEEFVDALAIQLDIWEQMFISTEARTNALDPSVTPSASAVACLATPTEAPTGSLVNTSTILDVLCALCGLPIPVDTNLSLDHKQRLAAVAGAVMARKATRRALMRVASVLTDGVLFSWTTPPHQFALILPDGAPSPGYGPWCARLVPQTGTVAITSGSATLTGTSTAFTSAMEGLRCVIGGTAYSIATVSGATSATLSSNAVATLSGQTLKLIVPTAQRPWILQTMRDTLRRRFPGAFTLGIGYSQFRAGYSSAGEVVMPSGATLNQVTNEHFSAWTGSTPDGWTKAGTGTLAKKAELPEINYEFTDYAAQIDLTGELAGVYLQLSQTTALCNGKAPQRLEVDYAYSNTQDVATLKVWLTTGASNEWYWDFDAEAWTTTASYAYLDPSASRTRFAADIEPLTEETVTAYLPTESEPPALIGVDHIKVNLSVISDETATTQIPYTLYRVGLYERFDTALDEAAAGERVCWRPLESAALASSGEAQASGSGVVLEAANAEESLLRAITSAGTYPYHPALSGRAYRAMSSWTNLIQFSWALDSSWSASSGTLSSTVGVEYPTVPGNSVGQLAIFIPVGSGYIQQASIVSNPSSKSYSAGVWLKGLSDLNPNGISVTISLLSGTTVVGSQTFDVSSSQWTRCPLKVVTFGGGHTSDLRMRIACSSVFVASNAYCFDVTSKGTSVLYPPPVVTISASATASGHYYKVLSSTPGSDTLHPLYKRQQLPMARGALSLTVVPTFSADQPSGYILDVAAGATTNRLALRVSSGALLAQQWDSAGNTRSCSLTLTNAVVSGQVRWLRDTAILIRLFWDSQRLALGAGDASTEALSPGSWVPTDTQTVFNLGADRTGANGFDGLLSNLEVFQIGALP